MSDSKIRARWAGVCLLGALAVLVASLSVGPSFDARREYFDEWFPGLVGRHTMYGIALGLIALTGALVVIAGLALYDAFRRAGAAGSAAGFVLVAAGGGFLLSSGLGVPAFRVMVEAARSPETHWLSFADAAHPWAAGSQTALIMFGLGGFAVGLVAVALAIIQAGGVSRRVAIGIAIAPLIPLAVLVAIPGADPLVWLSVGLPSLVWSVGLGVYLAATGRVTRAG